MVTKKIDIDSKNFFDADWRAYIWVPTYVCGPLFPLRPTDIKKTTHSRPFRIFSGDSLPHEDNLCWFIQDIGNLFISTFIQLFMSIECLAKGLAKG